MTLTFYKEMRPLEAPNVERLHKVFPRLADCLNNWEEFADEGYASFAVSVFDHWLNNDGDRRRRLAQPAPSHGERPLAEKRCPAPMDPTHDLIGADDVGEAGMDAGAVRA